MTKEQLSRKDRVIEVLRDTEGRLYSQVRQHPPQRYSGAVVIDRQHGRQQDENFVKNRARAIAALLELEYIEDLRWPCRALDYGGECHCPDCNAGRQKSIGVRRGGRPAEL